MMNKILVTGATGHLGRAVVNSLLNNKVSNLAVLVRDASKVEDLKSQDVEVRIGDYNDYDSLVNAFKGIDKLFFVSASDLVVRTKQHENAVKAAIEAGVKHVVYTSFQRVNETASSPISFVAEAHIKTEEWLKASGLRYTILKNGLYMDGLPMFMGDQVIETGVIYQPAGDGKAAYILRDDLAEASAKILATETQENLTFDFGGEVAYSYNDIATILTQLVGKPISYISPTKEEYIQTLTQAGVPEIYVTIFAGFADAIKQGEFAETSTCLEKILGRKPIGITDYLKRVYVK